MSVNRRLDQLEKKITELTGKTGERGTIIILRTWPREPDAVLTGYRYSGGMLPLDRTQWPPVPAGTRMIVRQAWSDEAARGLPVQTGAMG
ncbi:MAG TPA: hypothetical protein VN666_10180 [Nitrospira sp.]|nr:hypothetical protein [Nitrospira sp.]